MSTLVILVMRKSMTNILNLLLIILKLLMTFIYTLWSWVILLKRKTLMMKTIFLMRIFFIIMNIVSVDISINTNLIKKVDIIYWSWWNKKLFYLKFSGLLCNPFRLLVLLLNHFYFWFTQCFLNLLLLPQNLCIIYS